MVYKQTISLGMQELLHLKDAYVSVLPTPDQTFLPNQPKSYPFSALFRQI
jgi:hypothetical protein